MDSKLMESSAHAPTTGVFWRVGRDSSSNSSTRIGSDSWMVLLRAHRSFHQHHRRDETYDSIDSPHCLESTPCIWRAWNNSRASSAAPRGKTTSRIICTKARSPLERRLDTDVSGEFEGFITKSFLYAMDHLCPCLHAKDVTSSMSPLLDDMDKNRRIFVPLRPFSLDLVKPFPLPVTALAFSAALPLSSSGASSSSSTGSV